MSDPANDWNEFAPVGKMRVTKPDGEGSPASPCSACFTSRLSVTDGGHPIDVYECDGYASIERGEDEVGSGSDLFEAWNDYLYAVSSAPVKDAELAAMWAAYDAQNALAHGAPTKSYEKQKRR